MKIDSKVIETFHQLTKVNELILIKSDEIAVATKMHETVLYWKWDQQIESEFGIYNTNNFLNVLKLHDIESIKVDVDYDKMNVTSLNGKNTFKLVAEDLNEIFEIAPTKENFKNFLEDDPVVFKMSDSFIEMIQKQQGVVGAPHLTFEDNNVLLHDVSNTSINTYKKEVDVNDIIIKTTMRSKYFCIMKIDNYNVSIYENCIIFENDSGDICYVHEKLDV